MRFRSEMLMVATASFLIGCPSKQKQEPLPAKDDSIPARVEPKKTKAPTQSAHFSDPQEKRSETAYKSIKHPRDLFDWGKVIHEPYGERPKFTRSMQRRTKDLHAAVVKRLKGSRHATSLLELVSLREISHHGSQRPFDGRGIVHRLQPDRAGAQESWYKMGKKYAKVNPLYEDLDIWLSYGPQGMNSPLFLHTWDVEGDPRMLGDTVIADMTYLRAARNNMRKMQGERGVRCWDYDPEGQYSETFDAKTGKIKRRLKAKVRRDENGKPLTRTFFMCGPENFTDIDGDGREELVHRDENGRIVAGPDYSCLAPTWEFIHRATSGGKLCPPWEHDAGAMWYMRQFRRRAERAGLDPFELVSEKDLGHEPEGDQYELWMSIWDDALEKFDEPPMDWGAQEVASAPVN
jgi:hypothetical protein